MASDFGHRRWGAPVLLIMLLVAIGIFGAPARYSPVVSAVLTLVQLVVIGVATLALFLPAWRSGDQDRQGIAVAGLLLIVPWALLTLMPGFGPPFAATLAMNHERFVILFVSTVFLGGGLWLLKGPLAHGDAGDRLLAPLGQVSALFAVCVQLVWAALLIGWTMSEGASCARIGATGARPASSKAMKTVFLMVLPIPRMIRSGQSATGGNCGRAAYRHRSSSRRRTGRSRRSSRNSARR